MADEEIVRHAHMIGIGCGDELLTVYHEIPAECCLPSTPKERSATYLSQPLECREQELLTIGELACAYDAAKGQHKSCRC